MLERSIANHDREMAEMRAIHQREMADIRATMNANHEHNLREMAEMRADFNSTMNRVDQRIDNLSQTVGALVKVVEVHQRNHEIHQRNFEAVMAEVRGLRTESQRMLEHLFGNQGNQA